MHSQNNEEKYILRHFGNFKGRFLDIGAYDGKTFSNTYALLERGWRGDMVEPSEKVLPVLFENVKHFPVIIRAFAISTFDGETEFFDNDNAVATTVKNECLRWNNEEFEKGTVSCRKFNSVWSEEDKFHFINIDIEGHDIEVLKQIDIDKHDCKCICIEWNSVDDRLREIDSYLKRFGMRRILKNAENVIYVK